MRKGLSAPYSILPVVGMLLAHGVATAQAITPIPQPGQPRLTYHQVAVITDRRSDDCEFVAQQTCKTARTTEKCISWHRVRAADSGANAVVLLMTNTGGFSLFGKDTTMLANYYTCPARPNPTTDAEAAAVSDSGSGSPE